MLAVLHTLMRDIVLPADCEAIFVAVGAVSGKAPQGVYQIEVLVEPAPPGLELEPNDVENKVFCPNVGQVLAVTVKGGSDREELVSITHE